MRLWIAVAVLASVLVCGFAGGALWANSRAASRVASAQADAAVCADQLQSKAAAMERVRAQLADLQERHTRALAAAQAALDARDAKLDSLTARVHARAGAIRRNADDDPNTAALARLPVPFALAGQLWPVAAPAPTAH